MPIGGNYLCPSLFLYLCWFRLKMVLLYLSHDDGSSNRSSILLLQTTRVQTAPWQQSYQNGRAETGWLHRSTPPCFRAYSFLAWNILGYVHSPPFSQWPRLSKIRRISASVDIKSDFRLDHLWWIDTYCICALGYVFYHSNNLSGADIYLEIYSNVPNPLMPMNLFKDLRGFVCLNVMAACAGGLYVSLSILWPSRKS